MKVIVIGGTGHIGRFMVSKLVEAGCEVVVATSGRTAIPDDKDWGGVKCVKCDTREEESIDQLKSENAEVVIEIPGRAWQTYQSLKKDIKHLIACGSLWMFGESVVVPTPEVTQSPCMSEGYAERYARMLEMQEQSKKDGVAFTAIMPPNICGPGKIPLECLGGRDLEVHKQHAAGEEVVLPDGPEALIGPCDAKDIGACFALAVVNREKAAGEIFNVGSAYALTASQFVATYGEIYGKEIPVRKVSWQEYCDKVSPGFGHWLHFKTHMCPDISKAERLLGYKPQYTPEETLGRAVEWMREERLI